MAEQRQNFSIPVLSLSVAAAEFGRAVLGAGQESALRVKFLGGVLSTIALILFMALAGVNTARLNGPGFGARCIRSGFLLWYAVEFVRTAWMIQRVCWEQFSSMAFLGLLPLFLWTGWTLHGDLFGRAAAVLWWFIAAGVIVCILGLAGQLHWQNLVTGTEAFSAQLPDALLYPEYFSFPMLCFSKNNTERGKEWFWVLPVISAVISSGYALGSGLLFGVPQGETGYPGHELLRAWNFGGISRFDAVFLLLWLAAALFRLCFLLRAIRSLAESLGPALSKTDMPGAEGGAR